jgi:hypothetical protein
MLFIALYRRTSVHLKTKSIFLITQLGEGDLQLAADRPSEQTSGAR